MGLDAIEKEILSALQDILKRPGLKQSQIMEWSTSEEKVKKGLVKKEEDLFYLSKLGVWVAVLKEN